MQRQITELLCNQQHFSSVNRETGDNDHTTDALLYIYVEGQNCVFSDYTKHITPPLHEIFTAQHDIKHMVLNPPHNERSKAQGGSFIWWPKFWEPITDGLPYLRIPKENKKNIAKELLAFGVGPKEAVRGEKGLTNEKILRALIQRA